LYLYWRLSSRPTLLLSILVSPLAVRILGFKSSVCCCCKGNPLVDVRFSRADFFAPFSLVPRMLCGELVMSCLVLPRSCQLEGTSQFTDFIRNTKFIRDNIPQWHPLVRPPHNLPLLELRGPATSAEFANPESGYSRTLMYLFRTTGDHFSGFLDVAPVRYSPWIC